MLASIPFGKRISAERVASSQCSSPRAQLRSSILCLHLQICFLLLDSEQQELRNHSWGHHHINTESEIFQSSRLVLIVAVVSGGVGFVLLSLFVSLSV